MHDMSDDDDDMPGRLKTARKLAQYETPTDAAKVVKARLGIAESTYLGHENGGRGFRHLVVKYAALFQVDPLWLLTGTGNPRGRSIMDKIIALDPVDRKDVERYIDYVASKKSQ